MELWQNASLNALSPPPLPKKPPPLPPKSYDRFNKRATDSTQDNNSNTAKHSGNYCCMHKTFDNHRRPVVPVHPYNGQEDSSPSILHTLTLNGSQTSEDSFAKNTDKSEICIQSGYSAAALVSPKPPVPPKPTRKLQNICKKESTASAAITLACVTLRPQEQLVESNASLAVSPRGAIVSKCRESMAMALADDESTLRRSRLIAAQVERGDPRLSDLLLAAGRPSGVHLIGAVFRRQVPGAGTIPEGDAVDAAATHCSVRRRSTCTSTSVDLEEEKQELIKSLSQKLVVLEEALQQVEEEIKFNDQLGCQIWQCIDESVDFNDSDKMLYKLHVEDAEKITHLLLKLSSQMAKVEDELNSCRIKENVELQKHYGERQDRLAWQIKDAASLKQDLDARNHAIRNMLANRLELETVQDFDYFFSMKSQLLLDAKEIQDKIKLGCDQKQALISSIRDGTNNALNM